MGHRRRKYLIRFLLIATAAFLLLWYTARAQRASRFREVLTFVQNDVNLEHSHDATLSEVFKYLAEKTSYPREIAVNSRYDSNHLHLYVVKSVPQGQESSGSNALSELGSQPNAEAIQPNIILINSDLIRDLERYEYEEGIASGNSMVEEKQFEAKEPKLSKKIYIPFLLADEAFLEYYRLGDIDTAQTAHDISSKEDRWRNTDIPSVNDHLLQESNSWAKEWTIEQLACLLAPVVLHEIGHLETGGTGAMFGYSEDLAGRIRGPIQRRFETRADDFMLEHVNRLLASMRPDNRVLAAIPFLSAVRYIQNQAIAEGFRGFRGLALRELFITLFHKPCGTSWNFEDHNEIDHGYINALPLMTSREFAAVRDAMFPAVRSTHPHLFIRSKRLASDVEKALGGSDYFGWHRIVDEQANLVEAVIANDPRLMRRDEVSAIRMVPAGAPQTDLKLRNLLGGLSGTIQFEKAVNCAKLDCWVGHFTDNRPGFVEVIGPADNLQYARFTFRLFGNDPQGRVNGTDRNGYMLNMSLLFQVLSNVFDIDTKSEDWKTLSSDFLKAILEFRRAAMVCGGANLSLVKGKVAVQAYTMNPGDWGSIVIASTPYALPKDRGIFDVAAAKWLSAPKPENEGR
jgi:hypothetical protein